MNTVNNSPGYSYIQVTNNAGYVVRFSVTYTFKGKARTVRSSEFTLLQSDKIYIPNEATFIVLKLEEAVFIGKWVAFHLAFFLKPVTKCYSVSGTILKPVTTEIPCYDSGQYFENCIQKKSEYKLTDYMRLYPGYK